MEKYTPGPWFASEDGEVYSKPSYTSVAMVLMNERGADNARLIAAAPELLEALKDARSMLSAVEVSDGEDGDPWDRAISRIEAAIAKAEGRI